MTNTEQTEASTALVKAAAVDPTVLQKVADGAITWQTLLDVLAHPAVVETPPATAPLPVKINADQQAALDRLPSVFGKVVPTERREITPVEATALMEERATLKVVATMVKARDEDIRKAVFNSLDATIDAQIEDESKRPQRNPDGFYIAEGAVVDPETRMAHKREVRKGTATISTTRLEEVCDGGEIEGLSHADYLACTEQVRVFSPEKAMLHAKKKPAIIRAIAEATTRSADTIAFAPPRKA